MSEMHWSLLLGLATVGLGMGARRWPALAWVALTPLGLALYWYGPLPAAACGAVSGAGLVVGSFASRTLLPLMAIAGTVSALTWGALAAGIAALWPVGEPSFGALLIPVYAVLALLPLRIAGAPRWCTNPLAVTQEPWLAVVHIARRGSDLLVTAVLGASASVVVMASSGLSEPLSLMDVAAVLLALAFIGMLIRDGYAGFTAAIRQVDASEVVTVAAVSSDGPPPEDPLNGFWPLQSPHYADVEATAQRYTPLVAQAVAGGARLVVLPEVAVRVDSTTRQTWIDNVRTWSKRHSVTVVSAFFDEARPSNELVIVGPDGEVLACYEKQHPAPIEAPRHQRMPPARACFDSPASIAVSAVICVDLDYDDLVEPTARAGGVLAVPANDWPELAELHHRTAVWAAVTSGVSVLRSTGHGISSAYDAAGRVLRRQSSTHGPVVLLVDVPVAGTKLGPWLNPAGVGSLL